MPYCPDLDDLNNLFVVTKNQFDRELHQKNYMQNPYMSMFPKREYDYAEGRIPEVITTSYELPTEFPIGTAMGSISLNTGTGNSCLVDPQVIRTGWTTRNYQLQVKAFESPVICLTDLQFDYQAEQQIMNLQRGMTQFSTQWWTMWYQAQIIAMVDTKISTLPNGLFDEATSQGYDFNIPGLTTPTAQLEWTHLQPLYDRLARVGAGEFAVGYSNGLPDYALNIGPGYKRKLWQVDEGVRDTVNWGDAFENFTARGINKAIYGFIPNVDLFPVRYDGSLRYIPPFLNVPATSGVRFIPNPSYYTPARHPNGAAVYEVVTVTARNIFEVRVAPGGPTRLGDARFDPQNYAGDVRWINNKDMCFNKLGNMGQYRMDIRVAAKPIYSDNGFAILTLAYD